jgi:hypothetical protein
LTRHDVKRFGGKRQGQSIGLLPRDATIIWLPRRGMIEHGRIEIGCCDARALWKARGQRSGENACARGGLQCILRLGLGCSLSEIGGI